MIDNLSKKKTRSKYLVREREIAREKEREKENR